MQTGNALLLGWLVEEAVVIKRRYEDHSQNGKYIDHFSGGHQEGFDWKDCHN